MSVVGCVLFPHCLYLLIIMTLIVSSFLEHFASLLCHCSIIVSEFICIFVRYSIAFYLFIFDKLSVGIGYSRKTGFEGGQMPLQRRLPKRGFTNIFKKQFAVINLSTLQAAIDTGKLKAGETVSEALLVERGWMAWHWPVEHGGTGWTPVQKHIFEEEMIAAGETTEDMRQVAIREGMTTLREDAWKKIQAGVTTFEEALRVTSEY